MDAPLPPRLNQVLEGITDPEVSLKLRRVIEAAAHAIERLGQLNLMAEEPSLHEGSADLSLWESMAPAIGATVVDVNRLLQVIDSEFPDEAQDSVPLGSSSDEQSAAEAGMVFRAVAGQLERDVNEVGGMMRNPRLVGSGWALLGELQRLRADFRGRIGDAVYLSAAACTQVRREEVVPGFANELERAALFRSTAADVRRTVELKVDNATTPPNKLAKLVDVDFEIFATLPAWRHVRTEPKRQMLLLREQLQQAAKEEAFTHAELRDLVEPALALLRSLGDEQSEKVLTTHDRNCRTLIGQLLEQVEVHLELKTQVASAAFARAMAACDRLYGRDPDFDGFLRRSRARSEELSDADVTTLSTELKMRLSGLQI